MNRIKTLSLPLIPILLASSALTSHAQVALELSSSKTYRQDKNSNDFTGGRFNITASDGNAIYIGGCSFSIYVAPGFYIGYCSPGTTAYVTSGTLGGDDILAPYLLVTSLTPAVALEPRAADKILLNAAPASALPRPSGGFVDDSSSLYYNLNTAASVREYILTHYTMNRGYSAGQGAKFEKEIVPGAYHYSFPRLGYPTLPAPITAVIYPIVEAESKKNNREQGVAFTDVSGNKWNKDGFIVLSYRKPNTIKWKGFTPSSVFAGVDDLYFSIREISDLKSAKSPVNVRSRSIFPSFVKGTNSDPRILLRSPYSSSFTVPPVLDSGTRGVVELELQRSFQTGGVTYDFSNRRFQVPVQVVDYYKEYRDITFAKFKGKTGILDDPDKDGYNNLTEWILDSNGSDSASIPVAPVPALVATGFYDYYFGFLYTNPYFGFNVDKKLGTDPKVGYILQRSINGGKTWEKFRNGYYYADGTYSTVLNPFQTLRWTVTTVNTVTSGARKSQIQVRSGQYTDNLFLTPAQPDGTAGHLYRVKVVLK